MMQKYLIRVDGLLYFRTDPNPRVEYTLVFSKTYATDYTLDEANLIQAKFADENVLIEIVESNP